MYQFFNHSPSERHLDSFQLLAITKQDAINIHVNFHFSRINVQSAIAKLYGNCIFSFITNSQNVFYNGCTILHS